MLADRLRFLVRWEALGDADQCRAVRDRLGVRVLHVCPVSGDVLTEFSKWERYNSGTHQISIRGGSDGLWVDGSPGRYCGDGDSVFGSVEVRSLDLGALVRRALLAVSVVVPEVSPFIPFEFVDVKVVDITQNVVFESVPDALDFLEILKTTEGPRYKAAQTYPGGQYWGTSSALRSGKAYHKGPQLRRQVRSSKYRGRAYSDAELLVSDRIVRLELSLRRIWFSRNPWVEVSPHLLREQWREYFGRMLGGLEVHQVGELAKRVQAAAPTEGQGRAALGTWHLIQGHGYHTAQSMVSRSSWYRHLGILRRAGLADADFRSGKVIEFRRSKVLNLSLIDSWDEALAA